jgi:hypothetical protein
VRTVAEAVAEMVTNGRGSKLKKKKRARGAKETREKSTVAHGGRLVVVLAFCGEGDGWKTGDEGGGG